MKPLTKTVVSRGGGIAARFAKPVANTVANTPNPVANVANTPRYVRWREANPELYKQRQRDYMRKRRAKEPKE